MSHRTTFAVHRFQQITDDLDGYLARRTDQHGEGRDRQVAPVGAQLARFA
jgi:hypothetical protein